MQTVTGIEAGAAQPGGALMPAPVPADLEELAPGAKLAAVLAGIDVAAVSGFDAVRVLRAEYRQAAHARARLLGVAWEVALREYGSGGSVARMDLPDEFSADEVRAALGLTRRGADTLLNQAHELIRSRPRLHPAMLAGQLDEPRARVFAEWTSELSDEHAGHVCEKLLPRCAPAPAGSDREQLTTAQLVDEIKKIAIALDPDWAERRYVEALKRRRVVGSRNPDGTATLTGMQLPLDRVVAACGRLDALAKTAKRDGDPRPIHHIRAELFLGMTDGTYEGLTDRQILAALAATRPTSAPASESAEAGNTPDQDQDMTTEPVGATTMVEATPTEATPTETEPAGAEPAGAEPEALEAEIVTANDKTALSKPVAEPTSVAEQQPEEAEPEPLAPLSMPVPSRAGVELRVRLSTLLGLDRYPAEIAGWGPVHAELARQLADELGAAQWRYALTDEHGLLIHAGLTPARPAGVALRAAHTRAIVELQIPQALLTALTAGELAARCTADPEGIAAWAPVLADLARRAVDPDAAAPPEDPHRRFPGTALRREVQIRSPRCVAPGCRVRAIASDLDHEIEHARGGLTLGNNLAPRCRHDHRLRHEGGWLVTTMAGGYRWTTRLGHTHTVPARPILDQLPDPRPGPPEPLWGEPNPDRDTGGRHWTDSTCWDPGPARAQPPPAESKPDEASAMPAYPDEPPF